MHTLFWDDINVYPACHFLDLYFLYVNYSIMRFLLYLAGATVTAAAYVPGKAFDRFITIWLENQVYSLSPSA